MTFNIIILGHVIHCGIREANEVLPNSTGFICYAGEGWTKYGMGNTPLEALANFVFETALDMRQSGVYRIATNGNGVHFYRADHEGSAHQQYYLMHNEDLVDNMITKSNKVTWEEFENEYRTHGIGACWFEE